MHGPFDAQPGGEIDHPGIALPADGAQQFVAFDGLEVIEAQPMPWRGNEALIGRVLRPGQYGAKTLCFRIFPGPIKLQFVEPLLVEDDAALAAEDLEGNAALAPPGRATQSHDPVYPLPQL